MAFGQVSLTAFAIASSRSASIHSGSPVSEAKNAFQQSESLPPWTCMRTGTPRRAVWSMATRISPASRLPTFSPLR